MCTLCTGTARRTVRAVISSAAGITTINSELCADLGLHAERIDAQTHRMLEESFGPLIPGASLVDTAGVEIEIVGTDRRRSTVKLETDIRGDGGRSFFLAIPNAPRQLQFGQDFLSSAEGEMYIEFLSGHICHITPTGSAYVERSPPGIQREHLYLHSMAPPLLVSLRRDHDNLVGSAQLGGMRAVREQLNGQDPVAVELRQGAVQGPPRNRKANSARRRANPPYERGPAPPRTSVPTPTATTGSVSKPAMKCGYCCKEGTDVRECSCDHASLYRQLKLTGGARKNPPARLAVLANAAGIPHHITSPSTCLMQQAVEQSTGDVPTAVTFAQLRLAGLVGKTGPEPRAVLIDIANELARAMMKTTDITSEATHAVALRHDGAVAKSGGDRERCSMYAKAIVSYHQMVSNTIDQAMDALLEPGMSGAAGAADGITTDTQPMDARAAATVSEGMPLVAAAPGPVSTVVSTLNDPVEAETVDDGVMASWSAQDIVGSAAAATISVVTRDAGPSERVVVEAPMANPTLGVLEQAIAKEVAESGETLDLSETLGQLALEEPPGKTSSATSEDLHTETESFATPSATPTVALSRWSAQEVADARAALDAPHQLPHEGKLQSQVVEQFHGSLGAFWREYAPGFSSFWQGLPVKRRRDLLLCVSPAMPTTSFSGRSLYGDDVHGAAVIMPEMNLADLIDNGFTLLELFRLRSCSDLFDADMALIRHEVVSGRLPGRQHGAPMEFFTIDGQSFKVKDGNENNPQVQDLLNRGLAYESWLWKPTMMRQEYIQKTLAAVADEYRNEVLKDTKAYITLAPSWLPPGSQATTQAELERAWEEQCSHNYSLALARQAAQYECDMASVRDGMTAEPALIEAAVKLKLEANDLFARKSFRAANRCYTDAIDRLHIGCPREQDMSSTLKLVLSTLLSNRAACSIQLAKDQIGSDPEASSALLRAALTDCSSVLENRNFGPADVHEKVRTKLEFRQTSAVDLMRQVQESPAQADVSTAANEWLPPHLTRPGRGEGSRGRRRGPSVGRHGRQHATSAAETGAKDDRRFEEDADTVAVVRSTELSSTDAFRTDACVVCMQTWDGGLSDSHAMVLPCKHSLCARCLYNWHGACHVPREPRKPPPPSFACVECRLPIPSRAVEVLVAGVAAAEDSLQVLAERLECDTATKAQIVRSLLLHHHFNVSAVEGCLWEMAASTAAVTMAKARDPLAAEEKQNIYEEARRPVKLLETQVREARSMLKALRSDELSQEWRDQCANVADLESRLKVARLNAARDIFAQVNADGLGMGEDGGVLGDVTLDLHGLHVKEAERLMTELLDCVLPATRSIVIITGRGAHNAKGVSVLRPAIEKLVALREAASLEPVAGNPGAIRIRAK